MIIKQCKYFGCKEYAAAKSFYCKKHKQISDERRAKYRIEMARQREIKPFNKAVRTNSTLYNTSRWRILRKLYLEKNNWCVMCGSKTNLTVDHITPPRGNAELFFNEDNLQTLCSDCHRIKTNYEIKCRRK